LLDEKCGKESPGLGHFKGNLEAVRQLVMQLGKEHMEEGRSETLPEEAKPAAETSTAPAETPQTSAAGSAQPVTAKHVSGVISRAEAYQKLEEAADFLMRTEPHSPAPYLVKRAIAWGNMSLDELLQELIKEPGNLGFVYELLGIERNRGKQ